ncbi:MAG: hypothetical protein F9K40_07460 [Kofleriaceae bacterium]|nr:MAG: hypothetical protein F9K40_07460 [Kofleriaceae bacterium]
MTRRALSITVGVVGLACSLLMLVGMSVMGSIMADARTENITGPGVDVFLRTPFPLEGEAVVIDVAARGGSRAGIERIQVKGSETAGDMLAYVAGKGVTWGSYVRSGKTRGEATETVRFRVPDAVSPGETMRLTLYVDYVVAMGTGDGRTFENDHRSDVLHLDVSVYTPAGRRWARVALGGKAFAVFLVWFLLVWGIVALYGRTADQPATANGELEGIGMIGGLLGGGFIGYWLFARTVMAGYGTQSTLWAVALTTAWLVLPLAWVWKRWRARKAATARPGLPKAQIVSR